MQADAASGECSRPKPDPVYQTEPSVGGQEPMALVVVFVLAVLAGAGGAVAGIGWLAAVGLGAAALFGAAILWHMAAARPPEPTDAPPPKCPNRLCGAAAPPDALYCPRCGTGLELQT
jgi:hypothetical protein